MLISIIDFIFLIFLFNLFLQPSLAAENPIPDEWVYPGSVLLTEKDIDEICGSHTSEIEPCRQSYTVHYAQPDGSTLDVYLGEHNLYGLREVNNYLELVDNLTDAPNLQAVYVLNNEDTSKIIDWYKERFMSLGFIVGDIHDDNDPQYRKIGLVFCIEPRKPKCGYTNNERTMGGGDVGVGIDYYSEVNKVLIYINYIKPNHQSVSNLALDLKFVPDPNIIYTYRGRDKELNSESDIIGPYDPVVCTAKISAGGNSDYENVEVIFTGNVTLEGVNKSFSETFNLSQLPITGQYIDGQQSDDGNIYFISNKKSPFFKNNRGADLECNFKVTYKEKTIEKSQKLHVVRHLFIYLPVKFGGSKADFQNIVNNEHQKILNITGYGKEVKAILRFESDCENGSLGFNSIAKLRDCARSLNEPWSPPNNWFPTGNFSPANDKLIGLNSIKSVSVFGGEKLSQGFAIIRGDVAVCGEGELTCIHELGHTFGACEEYRYTHTLPGTGGNPAARVFANLVLGILKFFGIQDTNWVSQNNFQMQIYGQGCANPYPICANDNPNNRGAEDNNCYDIPNCVLQEKDGAKLYANSDWAPPAGSNFEDRKSVMGALTEPEARACVNKPFIPIYPFEIPK